MGMAVKGPVEHRVVRKAMDLLATQHGVITQEEMDAAKRLKDRADRGLERITARRAKRLLRSTEPKSEGYGHGI